MPTDNHPACVFLSFFLRLSDIDRFPALCGSGCDAEAGASRGRGCDLAGGRRGRCRDGTEQLLDLGDGRRGAAGRVLDRLCDAAVRVPEPTDERGAGPAGGE